MVCRHAPFPREYVDEQQHHKLAHRRGRVEQQNLLKPYAHNKINHCGHAREQHATGHALTIEHEEKSQVNERRARLALQDDEEHGGEYDGQGGHEMLPTVYVVAIGAHELGQSQGRGKLGKLGGLQPQRAEHKPRTRPLYLVGIEYGGEKEQQEGPEDDVGKGVVKPVVEHQQHKAEAHRRTYPHYLHARPRVEAEYVGVAIRIARAANAEPPESEQREVYAYCPPVERAQNARLLICSLSHTLYVCAEIHQLSFPIRAKGAR